MYVCIYMYFVLQNIVNCVAMWHISTLTFIVIFTLHLDSSYKKGRRKKVEQRLQLALKKSEVIYACSGKCIVLWHVDYMDDSNR